MAKGLPQARISNSRPASNETTAKIAAARSAQRGRAHRHRNEDSAGAVRLLGAGARRARWRSSRPAITENEQPLLSDVIISRALAPYADVRKGTIEDALARNVSVLVLADVGNVSGADHDCVAQFVENGGVLLRFAGGRMTTNVDDLVPVKLRVGGRYLGGALAWAAPQHLAPFPDASPFRGLDDSARSDGVAAGAGRAVRRTRRAHLGAADRRHAARHRRAQRGKGWIVLFHVTASPAWSSLPLSGLYVDMLRRVLDLAGGARPIEMGTDAAAVFPPYATLDGFGRAQKPPAKRCPSAASEFVEACASPPSRRALWHEGAQIALNAVERRHAFDAVGRCSWNLSPMRHGGAAAAGAAAGARDR
jgi:hypothetical protein